MEENDRRIEEAGGLFNLLIDSSVYHEFTKLESEIGINPLDLLMKYPKVRFFFTQSMISENVSGRMGLTSEALWMLDHSLQDEGMFLEEKESRFLYNDNDGNIRTVTMNSISAVDYSQILMTQNHQNLTLLTNDHKMLRSAGALLNGRMMDLQNMLDMFMETEDPAIRAEWDKVRKHYMATSGYKRPKSVHYIEDLERKPHPVTGEIPKLEPTYTRKKNKK